MADEEKLIQICYDLARSAARNGNHPFGALLASEDQILLTAENTVITGNDITRHAELNLVSQAWHELGPEKLAGSVLYTSTEPCPMCAGAIYWSGIRAVVFGCSARALAELVGDTFIHPIRELLANSPRQIRITGPILEKNGLEIHRGYW